MCICSAVHRSRDDVFNTELQLNKTFFITLVVLFQSSFEHSSKKNSNIFLQAYLLGAIFRAIYFTFACISRAFRVLRLKQLHFARYACEYHMIANLLGMSAARCSPIQYSSCAHYNNNDSNKLLDWNSAGYENFHGITAGVCLESHSHISSWIEWSWNDLITISTTALAFYNILVWYLRKVSHFCSIEKLIFIKTVFDAVLHTIKFVYHDRSLIFYWSTVSGDFYLPSLGSGLSRCFQATLKHYNSFFHMMRQLNWGGINCILTYTYAGNSLCQSDYCSLV